MIRETQPGQPGQQGGQSIALYTQLPVGAACRARWHSSDSGTSYLSSRVAACFHALLNHFRHFRKGLFCLQFVVKHSRRGGWSGGTRFTVCRTKTNSCSWNGFFSSKTALFLKMMEIFLNLSLPECRPLHHCSSLLHYIIK